MPDLDRALIFFRFAFGFGILMLAIFSIFFYYFPKISYEPSKIFRWLFLVSVILIVSLSYFTPLIHKSIYLVDGVYDDTDVLGPLYPLYNALALLYFIVAAFIATKKTLQLKGVEKKKIIISAIGGWIFLLMAASTNVFLPLFGIWKVGFLDIKLLMRHSPIFTLFFIIPTFYSIHRYRFFNFSNTSLNILRKTILYTLFFIMVLVTHKFFLIYFEQISNDLHLLISVFIAMAVYTSASKVFPTLYSESFRLFRNILTEFKSRIYFCDDYEKLHKLIEQIFQISLNIERADLFVIRKQKSKLKIPIYIQDEFSKELKYFKKDLLIKEEIPFKNLKENKKTILKKGMEKLNADICIPLFSDGTMIGFFALRGESVKLYTKEEIQELQKVKKHLEIGLMNILLTMNLQKENDLMKAIIDTKTKELKKRLKEIKELLEQQSDFIAVTAHEFRTPLSIAIFQLEEVLGKQTVKTEKELRVIDNSLTNLKNLTGKLFDVQQYDLKKVPLNAEKIEIVKFIKDIHKDFQLTVKKKGINFVLKNKLKNKAYLNIDKAQIRQVFHNIINNAYKFTDEKGTIELQMESKAKHILIKISDSGKGIPDTMKKTVFKKFKTRKPGSGIGLGLYICKKIMQLHKGKIWVEDSPLGGAAFYLQLNKLST
ncbi:hypothetical protein KAR91_25200 [Candidatus Pacearchaeota archaeon]|nr:hypothetical protein [Candidatus Pacearchaeota archaeon]